MGKLLLFFFSSKNMTFFVELSIKLLCFFSSSSKSSNSEAQLFNYAALKLLILHRQIYTQSACAERHGTNHDDMSCAAISDISYDTHTI